MESSTWARIDRGSTVCVISRMRSASVDLPWSMWAMIEKLRMCAWSAMRAPCRIGGASACILASRRRGAAPRLSRSERRGPRGRLVVGEGDAVATVCLDPVQGAIGAAEHARVRLPLLRHRDADREGDAEARLRDGRPKAPAGLERLGGIGHEEQGGEPVAADAEQRVAATQRAAERAGALAEDAVAVLVAEGVVEALEAVDVDEHDGGARPAVGVGERGVEGRVVA